MQELYVDELRNRSITELDSILSQNETDSILRAKSRTAIRRELEAMEGEGKVSFMTDEEVALLHNFRRFKSHLPKGKRGTFTFETFPDLRTIIPGGEASLIQAPDADQLTVDI